MKFIFKNRDRRVSVFTFLLAVYWLVEAQNIRVIANFFAGSDPGAKLFPQIIGIIMIITSIGKFITCNQEEDEPFFGKTGVIKVMTILLIVSLYAFLMKYFGYIITTFIAAIAFLLAMKEEIKMKWFTPIIYSATFTAISFFVFKKLLSVRLPVGTVIKAIEKMIG